jgi:hypothetical protein
MDNENSCFFLRLESDFIDVPTIAKSTEPILLPSDDEDIIETSHNNTSSELIELDQDNDSSHNSTAIEDIKMFIDNDKDQPLTNDVEIIAFSQSQLVRRNFIQTKNKTEMKFFIGIIRSTSNGIN